MGVHVDEPRGDHEAAGVDRLVGWEGGVVDLGDPVVFDQEVTSPGRQAGAIDEGRSGEQYASFHR